MQVIEVGLQTEIFHTVNLHRILPGQTAELFIWQIIIIKSLNVLLTETMLPVTADVFMLQKVCLQQIYMTMYLKIHMQEMVEQYIMPDILL